MSKKIQNILTYYVHTEKCWENNIFWGLCKNNKKKVSWIVILEHLKLCSLHKRQKIFLLPNIVYRHKISRCKPEFVLRTFRHSKIYVFLDLVTVSKIRLWPLLSVYKHYHKIIKKNMCLKLFVTKNLLVQLINRNSLC